MGWPPGLQPIEEALTDRHRDGLTDPPQAKSPCFMPLVHDPDLRGARTRADRDIFQDADIGLPRAELDRAGSEPMRGLTFSSAPPSSPGPTA